MASSTTVPMGECCLSGSVHSGTPTGREDTIGGLPCYIAEPSSPSDQATTNTSVAANKRPAVIFLVDIFGWKFPNLRLLADNYAKAGNITVYIPDIHEGDSLDIEFLQTVEPPLKVREQQGVLDKAKQTAGIATTLGPWLIKHREAVTEPIVSGFVNAVRQIPGTNKIGALGFCWGGRYAILQTHASKQKSTEETPVVGGVDAAVACHPSLVTVPGDFENVAKPLSLACGEKDSQLDMGTVEKIKELLAKKTEVPTEVKVYEDQIHGFALRSDWGSDKDKKAMDEAEKQGVEWFTKYLS